MRFAERYPRLRWSPVFLSVGEVIVGKAIKQHNLPRENLVIMTKVKTIK